MNEVESTVRRVLVETVEGIGGAAGELPGEANLLENGILDSFGFLDFIGALENAFEMTIEITSLDEERMVTVAGMAAEIIRLREG